MTAWASVADVLAVTARTVTEADVASAQAVIDLESNRTVAASAVMSPRDRGWLRQAVCWQAAWATQNPSWDGRNQVTSLQQDGQSATVDKDSAIYLAPLARKALNNLSWRKSRSLRIRSPFQDNPLAAYEPGARVRDYDDSDDVFEPWTPLGGG